ncbi:hypothetical protein QTP88_024402 [Uroleucon formosanum]
MQIQCMVGFWFSLNSNHMKKLYLLQVLVKKKKVLKDNTLRENVYVKVKEPNSGRFLSGYVV